MSGECVACLTDECPDCGYPWADREQREGLGAHPPDPPALKGHHAILAEKERELAEARASLRKLIAWVETEHKGPHYNDPFVPCAGPGKCQTLIDLAEARRVLGGEAKEKAAEQLSGPELAFDLVLISGAIPNAAPNREWSVARIQEAAARLDPKSGLEAHP